jgi:hypothetical protein
MAVRKKWKIVVVPVLRYMYERRATSERDAFTQAHAALRRPDIRQVTVMVDERRGQGWERFEVLTPADLPADSASDGA